MSFNAKNLSYEAKEPAFLQRLKSQYGGANSRVNPQQRPRKQRNDDDDDDAPTYVDEGSNEVISKEEYEAMLKGDDPKDVEADSNAVGQASGNAPTEDGSAETAKRDGPKTKQNVAGIGGPKKRKQAKVVGEEAVDEEGEGEERHERKPVANKPKQRKKKKVKLSFDEPEGD